MKDAVKDKMEFLSFEKNFFINVDSLERFNFNKLI